MANTSRNAPERAGTSQETERETVRSSNDRDQAAERDGMQTEHNRGYDDAVRGNKSVEHEDLGDVDPDSADVDPDSAESDVDRDDA